MDIIQQCLALSAVPGLGPAFSVFRFIWLTIEQVQLCKQQLIALMHSTAQLLETLDAQFRGGQLSEVKNSTPLANLIKLVIIAPLTSNGESSSILMSEKAAARNLAICPGSGHTGLLEIDIFKGSAYCSN